MMGNVICKESELQNDWLAESDRKRDDEATPFAYFALQRQSASMHLYEIPRYRQFQSAALYFGSWNSEIGLENAFMVVGFGTPTKILNI